jgi:hypothetical protein
MTAEKQLYPNGLPADPLALWIAGKREDGTFWAIDMRTGRPMDPKDEAEFALLEARKECPECKKYARSAELDLSVERFCPKHRS